MLLQLDKTIIIYSGLILKNLKCQIYKTLMKLVVIYEYGSENWTSQKVDENALSVFEYWGKSMDRPMMRLQVNGKYVKTKKFDLKKNLTENG